MSDPSKQFKLSKGAQQLRGSDRYSFGESGEMERVHGQMDFDGHDFESRREALGANSFDHSFTKPTLERDVLPFYDIDTVVLARVVKQQPK